MGILADLETKLGSINPAAITADLEAAKATLATYESRITSLETTLLALAPAVQAALALLPAGSVIPTEVSAFLAALPKPAPSASTAGTAIV